MQQKCLIGIASSYEYSHRRDVMRKIVRFARQYRPHWHFVFAAPNVATHATKEMLKKADVVIVGINNRKWCDLLLQTRVPVINLAVRVPGLPIPFVNTDPELIGKMAAQHFLERGFRSFAYVGERCILFSQQREDAFRSAIHEFGHDGLAVYNVRNERKLAPMGCLRFEPKFTRWLLSLALPTGILAMDDLWGAEIIETSTELGLRVPEDIAVLGVGNDDLSCMVSQPPLSSIILPAEAIGKRVAAIVEELLESGKRTLPHNVLLPPTGVVVRRSTEVLVFDDPDVVHAVRFIRENCHRPIQVSDVIKEIPYGRRWLERRVHEAVGITLGALIRRSRLEQAKRLMVETDMSISEVARHSEYTDLRHLELAFRKEQGCTPTQFRSEAGGRN